jgi:hypothetical protein
MLQPLGAVKIPFVLMEPSMFLAGDAPEISRVIVEGVEVHVMDDVSARNLPDAVRGLPYLNVELSHTGYAAAVRVGREVDPRRPSFRQREASERDAVENDRLSWLGHMPILSPQTIASTRTNPFCAVHTL